MCQCEIELKKIFGTITNERDFFLFNEILKLLHSNCACNNVLTDDQINQLG